MLELRNISKVFPGVKALEDVSLSFKAGEVHAICGENGAGKSTLMNIVAGNIKPTKGVMLLDGDQTIFNSSTESKINKISIVYQENSLAPSLNVAENIFIANRPTTKFGTVDNSKLYENTNELLTELNISDFSADSKISGLSPGQRQLVEIAKALSNDPRILLLDEPTASLSEDGTHTLFKIIKELRNKGTAIIYVSHRMSEILHISDRISVLKDGKYQGTVMPRDTSVDAIIKMMVGRDIQRKDFESFRTGTSSIMKVENLTSEVFSNVSFEIYKGEILGLAGLMGAGRTELAQTIFGARPKKEGNIYIHGVMVQIDHPSDAMYLGIVYVPEERKTQGAFLQLSVGENIVASSLRNLTKSGFMSSRKVNNVCNHFLQTLKIRTPSLSQEMIYLSGGNQQKVILSRALSKKPIVIIADEPTHGIDVGAKMEIYDLLKGLSKQGVAILLISSEMPELLYLSDRIMVLQGGIQKDILVSSEVDEESILKLATG